MKRHTFREFGQVRYAPNLHFRDGRAAAQFMCRENHRWGHPQEMKSPLVCEEQLGKAAEIVTREEWP